MSQFDEPARLRASVKRWFEHETQVAHYRGEADELTSAEEWLLSRIGHGEHVLDVGCGAGRVARLVAGRGCTVTGVDVSFPLLQAAHAANGQLNGQLTVDYLQTEPLHLPFRDAVFSSIVAFKIYGYIPTRAARIEYLAQLCQVLVPAGVVYLTQNVVPAEQWREASIAIAEANAQYEKRYTSLEAGDTFTAGTDGGGYMHWFTPQALRNELEEAGGHLDLFELDMVVGGEGYLALARLRNA